MAQGLLEGYYTADQAIRQRDAAKMQQLQGILSMRGAMAQQEEAKRMGPLREGLLQAQIDELKQKPLDRAATRDNTRELRLAGLRQAATNAENTHRYRMANLSRQEDRDAEIARHNAFREQIDTESLAISGKRLFFDTGMTTGNPPPRPAARPQMSGLLSGQQGMDAALSGRPQAEQAAILAVQAAGDTPMTVDVGNYQPPPPQATPAPGGVRPAPPPLGNEDMHDRRMVSDALGSAPLPAPQPAPSPQLTPPAPAAPVMPNFTGSPRQIHEARNRWLQAQGKADINLAGGRESVFINRVVQAGNQAAADLENIAKLPISTSRGIFGGRGQGKSLFEAAKETLATSMTTQDVQSYNVLATGFQRTLAAIEASGLAPSGQLTHQMDAVIFKEGDTNFTKLQKMAQIRQIVEKGMESTLSNPRVPKETKDHVKQIMDKIERAVPFTQLDLLGLQESQQVDPNITLSDVMKRKNQPQKTPGGASVSNW